MKKIFTTLWLLFSLHSISQTVHYVNDNATGANIGAFWANAFSKLQDALAKAVSGDQVWVAEGIYYPDEGVGFTDNNSSHSFRLKNGVAIYGGFAGTETNLSERNWNTHVTTLSGDIGPYPTENAYHVVVSLAENNTALLDGFTITNGYAIEDSRGGGGIYTLASSPTIRNCNISGNGSGSLGGGILNDANSAPQFINCTISGNETGNGSGVGYGTGGGIYNYYSTAQFINCTISGNVAYGHKYYVGVGGGFYNDNSSSKFTNCIIYGNSVTKGGLVDILNQSINNQGNPLITYSIIEGGYAGTGNLDMDPLFLDAANGDLRLKAGSPAIDAGLTSANTTTLDLDGKPRVVNGIIDMGAYEYQVATMVITSVTANPSTLWPPNHKMKEVKVTTVTTGGSGNTQCLITAVSSNEPQSNKKKGHSSPDWQITGPDKVLLRAERNGNGNGRIYTITVTCSDGAGSRKSKTVQVKVPHDQGHNFITSNAPSNSTEAIKEEAKGSLKAVPNPFSSQARISFTVPESGYTTLDVIDATGVRVERLYATQAEAGKVYTLSFGNNKLKSGMYLLRLTTGKHVQTYRLMLMQ